MVEPAAAGGAPTTIPGASTIPSARCATWSSTTCCSCWQRPRWRPAGGDPETMKGAQTAIVRAIAAADPGQCVRGQYDGYRSISGVAADSTTETYAALRLDIENWRWSGVPIYIRTGKGLPVTQTEMRLVFTQPPRLGFHLRPVDVEPDQLIVRLDPATGVRLVLITRRADDPAAAPIHLDMEFADEGGGVRRLEVLLHAALVGQNARFSRQDTIEEAWRIMQPLVDQPAVHTYTPGSWGPDAANTLVASNGGWRQPWVR